MLNDQDYLDLIEMTLNTVREGRAHLARPTSPEVVDAALLMLSEISGGGLTFSSKEKRLAIGKELVPLFKKSFLACQHMSKDKLDHFTLKLLIRFGASDEEQANRIASDLGLPLKYTPLA